MTSRPRTAHNGQIAFRGLRGFVSSESPANDSSFTSVFGGIDLSRQIEKQNATTEIVSQFAHSDVQLRGIMFDTILAVD